MTVTDIEVDVDLTLDKGSMCESDLHLEDRLGYLGPRKPADWVGHLLATPCGCTPRRTKLMCNLCVTEARRAALRACYVCNHVYRRNSELSYVEPLR